VHGPAEGRLADDGETTSFEKNLDGLMTGVIGINPNLPDADRSSGDTTTLLDVGD
jgi:hypothetical protein